MNLVANWSYPTNILFGENRISEIARVCQSAGITKPLFVTDKGLADMDITSRTLDFMDAAGLGRAVFSAVDPNPTDANVASGLKMYREGRFDGVVAFGGGSALDIGKVLGFMAGQSRSLWEFEDIGDNWTRADADRIHPVVAIPTTAGTGSEVGRASIITNSETREKKIIFHPKMLPSAVICVEAYSSPHYHPMSQGIALEGIRLVKEYLPKAHNDGHDVEARAHMMSAAAMGATAFQKGLGAIHALSHPIGAVHHGICINSLN